FLAVIRVALLTAELDAIARSRTDSASDPHRVALLAVSSGDRVARPVARVGLRDRVESFGGDLRFVPESPPPEIAALLQSPLVHGLDADHPNASGMLSVN